MPYVRTVTLLLVKLHREIGDPVVAQAVVPLYAVSVTQVSLVLIGWSPVVPSALFYLSLHERR